MEFILCTKLTLTKMTTEVFDKLNALVLFLLPEFQMTINTGGYDEVCPKK